MWAELVDHILLLRLLLLCLLCLRLGIEFLLGLHKARRVDACAGCEATEVVGDV